MVIQCAKDETLKQQSVMDNLVLKVNGKLGGVNWQVSQVSVRWGRKIVMVMSADVTSKF